MQLRLFGANQLPLFSSQEAGAGDQIMSPTRPTKAPRLAIIERDKAFRGGELHHILGRSKPRGWKSLPEPLKSAWPEVPMNMVILPVLEHRPFAHISGRAEKARLLQGLLDDHGHLEWPAGSGLTYSYWLLRAPFIEFLEV